MSHDGPDLETARRWISAAYSPPQALRFLGAGRDFAMYLADEAWVYRFPQGADVVPFLRAEQAILAHLQHLPVPTPRPARFAEPAGERRLPFAGYRFLPGTPLSAARPAAPLPLLRQLWAMLDVLHATPAVEPFTETAPWPPDPLRPVHPTAEAVIRFLDAHPVPAPPAVLCHNDLGMGHVLVDPAQQRVVGVIDWGDMAWTDPAVDWVGMLWSYPDQMEAAWGRTDPERLARAWRHGLRFSLLDLLDHVDDGTSAEAMAPAWARLAARLARAQRSPVF